MTKLAPFRSERTVCSINDPSGRFKVVQIVFQKRDGSVFVTLPYYPGSDGLVSKAVVPPRTTETKTPGVQVDLKPGGKVTSHLVKYAHHPDGEAHFSQGGKVFTAIRRKAVPLDAASGHLFTVHVVGYDEFTAASASELSAAPTRKKTLLNFEFPEKLRAVKLVGRLFTEQSLTTVGNPPIAPGPILTQDGTGRVQPAFVIAPPTGWPGDYRLLMLTAEEWVTDDVPPCPHVSLIGGFDHPSQASDVNAPTEVLVLSYPVDSLEELQADLGSIDYTPGA